MAVIGHFIINIVKTHNIFLQRINEGVLRCVKRTSNDKPATAVLDLKTITIFCFDHAPSSACSSPSSPQSWDSSKEQIKTSCQCSEE